MAHIKQAGTTKGNKDSRSKRLGVKLYGGQKATEGAIIVRQTGTKVHPGTGVKMGTDYTIFSLTQGTVKFSINRGKKVVSVEA